VNGCVARALVLTAALVAGASSAPAAEPGTADDLALALEVMDSLLSDEAVAGDDAALLEVQAWEGVVTLAGEVPSPEVRRAAVARAAAVPGVRAVRDELRVEPGRGEVEGTPPAGGQRARVRCSRPCDPGHALAPSRNVN
jgi:hypothetical protein